MSDKKCLKTDYKITSPEWNRSPVCNCKNCNDYFAYCKKVGLEQAKLDYSK